MAANSSLRQNNATPSSPESAESSSAANDEAFFDVCEPATAIPPNQNTQLQLTEPAFAVASIHSLGLIKGVRIFWNFNTRTTQKVPSLDLHLRQLTEHANTPEISGFC